MRAKKWTDSAIIYAVNDVKRQLGIETTPTKAQMVSVVQVNVQGDTVAFTCTGVQLYNQIIALVGMGDLERLMNS